MYPHRGRKYGVRGLGRSGRLSLHLFHPDRTLVVWRSQLHRLAWCVFTALIYIFTIYLRVLVVASVIGQSTEGGSLGFSTKVAKLKRERENESVPGSRSSSQQPPVTICYVCFPALSSSKSIVKSILDRGFRSVRHS